jgi:hypothetical protein
VQELVQQSLGEPKSVALEVQQLADAVQHDPAFDGPRT